MEIKESGGASRRVILGFGVFFLLMEAAKQGWLYFIYFGGPDAAGPGGGAYNIWYLPFQLCSMPLYLCLWYGLFWRGNDRDAGGAGVGEAVSRGTTVLTFLMDFGFLGGLCALLVRTGFTQQGQPVLMIHGYLWHIGMLALAVYIFAAERGRAANRKGADPGRSDGVFSWRSFEKAAGLFFGLAAAAVALNILLHHFGNADFFYLSPFHRTTQPVFHDIEGQLGRLAGKLIYVASVVGGSALVHGLWRWLARTRGGEA